MKKIFVLMAMAMATLATAQTNPLWMRFSAISPDGSTIAFSYKGDIYTVSSNGGNARQLTTNNQYDSYPVWSPDGQKIAFASSREGSLDVYIMGKNGGTPKRLTTNSADEVPMAFKDNNNVLISAVDKPTAKSIYFASGIFPQVYQVDINGGRPKMFSATPMMDVSVNAQGDILYHDQKGYEDKFRKHQKSAIARDIWIEKGGKHTKITTFEGEDRTPVWGQGNSFYYLSEEDGTFNVYKRNIDGSGKKQLSFHKTNPVRFLTVANNGLLCYGQDGEIYTLKEGGKPTKVNISITTDQTDEKLIREIKRNGATEIRISPNGKEVAFVLRGDIFVTSVEYPTTKQITDTPDQERDIDFAPDGRTLVYGSDRAGIWQIFTTKIKNDKEKYFTYATDLVEEALVKSGKTSLQPKFSPDGKSVAFFEERADLKVIDVKSKAVVTAMDGKYIYSYSDGDLWFEWSPDSNWLLTGYMGNGGWNNPDVALVKADGKELHNITNSGYSEANAKWVLGGKAVIFYSDRAGFRSHGSWGAEDDVYIMFFDLDAYEKFRMSKEEGELAKEMEKSKEEVASNDKNDKKDKKSKQDKKEEEKPLKLDIENAKYRVERLTVNSSKMGDALLSPEGDVLYYLTSFEDDLDLWKQDLKDGSTSLLLKGIGYGRLEADKDFNNLFVCANGAIKKIKLGENAVSEVTFEATFNHRPYEEREYMFNHIWQQVKEKFYVKDLHGVDWAGYKEIYKKFLPHINNNYDYRDMLSEMLGELNASHTGARYYQPGPNLRTATLGVFFDDKYEGDGLKIEEVVKRSPFTLVSDKVKAGCIIEQIDGVKILKGMDYNHLLDGKIGKPVRISIADPKGEKFDVTIKPISKSAEQNLLYDRWVERNKEMVDKLSGGKLAYVHVRAMNSESFRTVYRNLLSEENRTKDAVIVDERHNGGGWLHDDLCTLLNGKEYQKYVPQGKYMGSDPFAKWTKPSCVLICEDDYSNGHGFPFVYKELKIGKLIGTPVAGTMTAVWWETLLDPDFVFGIPQVGVQDMRGKYQENNQLYPDVEVYNTPENFLEGRDVQLERAVIEMMKK